MQVHCSVSPSINFAGTHLFHLHVSQFYTSMKACRRFDRKVLVQPVSSFREGNLPGVSEILSPIKLLCRRSGWVRRAGDDPGFEIC